MSRRSLLSVVAGCVALLVVAGAVDAATYPAAGRDTIRQIAIGFDPNDRPAQGWIDPDIRVTTRIVTVDDAGKRWLILRFRTFDYIQAYWSVLARLDARGGARTDAKISFFDDGLGHVRCKYKAARTKWRRAEFRLLSTQMGAQCKVPMGSLRASKPIRWKLFSPKSLEPGYHVDEYAPDHGWYG